MGFEDILDLIEVIISLIFVVYFIFAMFKIDIKWGILSILGLVLLFFGIVGFDKFLNYIFEEQIWLLVPLLIILALCGVIPVICVYYNEYKKNPKATIERIKKEFTVLLKCILISVIILGLIVFFVVISDS